VKKLSEILLHLLIKNDQCFIFRLKKSNILCFLTKPTNMREQKPNKKPKHHEKAIQLTVQSYDPPSKTKLTENTFLPCKNKRCIIDVSLI